MNLTLSQEVSTFRKTIVAFIEQHWSESEIDDLSKPVAPTRKRFLKKKLEDWYNKIFENDWDFVGFSGDLFDPKPGSMQRYVWISECGSRNLPSPLKSPGVGIVAPIVLALGGKKQIEAVLPGIRQNEVSWGIGFSDSRQNQGDLKLEPGKGGVFLSGRAVVAHLGEKSDWVLIIHCEEDCHRLLFVESTGVSFSRLSADIGLAFTSISELIFDREKIDDGQILKITNVSDWEKVLGYSIHNYLFYQSPLYLMREAKKLKDLYRLGNKIEGIDQRFSELEIEIEALAVSEIRTLSNSETKEPSLLTGELNSQMTDLLIKFQQLELDLSGYELVSGQNALLAHNEPDSDTKDAAHLINKMLYINAWSEGLISRSDIRDHLANKLGIGRFLEN